MSVGHHSTKHEIMFEILIGYDSLHCEIEHTLISQHRDPVARVATHNVTLMLEGYNRIINHVAIFSAENRN